MSLTALRSLRPSSRQIDLLIVAGFLFATVTFRAFAARESDQFWGARAGLENLADQPLARPDTWSWAEIDGLWYQNSPLWNIGLGISFEAGGYLGIVLFGTLAIGFLVGLMARLARSLGARPLPALFATAPLLVAMLPYLSPRATAGAEALVLTTIGWALWWANRAHRHPVLLNFAISGLVGFLGSGTGLWAHLAFLAWAPLLALVWIAIWLLTPRLDTGRTFALSSGGTLGWALGFVAMPYGLATVVERSLLIREMGQGEIIEWTSPLDPQQPPIYIFIMLAAIASALAASAWLLLRLRRRALDHVTRSLAALVIVGLPTALAGVSALRFSGVALPVLAPPIAAGATRALDMIRPKLVHVKGPAWLRTRVIEYSTGRFWRIVLGLVLVLLGPAALAASATSIPPPEKRLIEALPERCRLFSASGLGSRTLLFRHDIEVWIDGRLDFYGRTHLAQEALYLSGQAEETVPPGTTCVLLDADDTSSLRDRLSETRGWRPVARHGPFEVWLPA